jgi:hypothetical protein
MRNPRSGGDDPAEIGLDESREELLGGTSPEPGILGAWDLIAIALAILAAVLAAMTLDSWQLWVVLGAIIAVVAGFVIAVSPTRRG